MLTRNYIIEFMTSNCVLLGIDKWREKKSRIFNLQRCATIIYTIYPKSPLASFRENSPPPGIFLTSIPSLSPASVQKPPDESIRRARPWPSALPERRSGVHTHTHKLRFEDSWRLDEGLIERLDGPNAPPSSWIRGQRIYIYIQYRLYTTLVRIDLRAVR